MDEELLKRNTDCVYFLASPLTCKKGLDCEYRHSEIARLNPRDCWYWLAGNCLNPTCGFRHPPLEKHSEAPSETSLPYPSSVPGNKTSVPCYFYFNGFCNKGDRCSFLHGPDGNTPNVKSVKASSTITDSLPLDTKTSVGNDNVSAPTEQQINQSKTAPKASVDLKLQPNEDVQQPVFENLMQQSSPIPITMSQYEETFLQGEGFVQSGAHICADQSSEERVDDRVEPEERWESSPGFDVLVDDKSEDLDYEDDQEYLPALDREHSEVKGQFLGYEYEDAVGYDPAYPTSELLNGADPCDSVECMENLCVFDDVKIYSGRSRDRLLDSLLSRKRKLFSVEPAIRERRGTDLRDHLRKRRVADGCPFTQSSRRLDSCRQLHQRLETHQRHGIRQRLHGRLASFVGRNAIESLGDNGTLPNGASQGGWLRHSRSNKSRQRYKEKQLAKRQLLSSGVPRKQAPREKRSTQVSLEFSGPKTLAQIKEEKKKAEENGVYPGKIGHSSGVAADFEGPKPFSEILEDKKKTSICEQLQQK